MTLRMEDFKLHRVMDGFAAMSGCVKSKHRGKNLPPKLGGLLAYNHRIMDGIVAMSSCVKFKHRGEKLTSQTMNRRPAGLTRFGNRGFLR